jgi:hypothetical protein
MKRKRNNQPMDFGDFLVRCLLWGGLGYIAGARGSKLGGIAFFGPISEQALGYSLEDVGEALKRQRQQKELEERISRIFEQSTVPPTLPEGKPEDSLTNRMLLPPSTFDLKLDSLLLKRSEFNEPDIRWLDLIVPPSIVLLLGGRGSGKTALGFRLLELFRYKLTPYVIGLPSQCAHLLPDWIGIEERLEDVPSWSISLVDEAYLSNHARDWAKAESRDLCRLLNLSRQQNKTIIFSAQQGRQINLDIASSANVMVLKNPGMLQTEFERPALRQIVSDAKLAFETISGDRKKWSYVYSPDAGFNGLVENILPTFWSQKLSRMYGQGTLNEKAAEKHPSKMTLEQKKEKARELYEKGWSLSRIAKYFGVSKSTVFNWIHDYPYPKKRKLP